MQKPDFSGEWTLNVGASRLSPMVAPAVQTGFVRIDHREPTIAVHLSITMDGKPVEFRFERSSNSEDEALVFTDTIDNSQRRADDLLSLSTGGFWPATSRDRTTARCWSRAGQRVGVRSSGLALK